MGIRVTIVEPGQFRTDFAGRSLTQSSTPIPDYAETAGKRRIENDTADGNQQGDPDKAAQAIISVAESADPPLMLLLGTDALEQYRATCEAERLGVETWKHVTIGTDFLS